MEKEKLKPHEIIDRIVNVIVACYLAFMLYLVGALVFKYDVPECISHHPTKQESDSVFENFTLPIKVKEFQKLIKERDSLRIEVKKLKEK